MKTPSDLPSPCISICALNEQDICIGCFRSGGEISQWGDMSDAEKRAVLARSEARRAASQSIQLK